MGIANVRLVAWHLFDMLGIHRLGAQPRLLQDDREALSSGPHDLAISARERAWR
jgi:hypothetical protein